MSSFDERSHIYLFDLTTGKKKLAYGTSPEDALDILAMRLCEEEMATIKRESFRVISHQRELRALVKDLG
jgi:hypothetical protein